MSNLLKKTWCLKIFSIYYSVVSFIEHIPLSLLMLWIRLWMAKIFWYSGLTKIAHWPSTVYLFQYEYKVPFLHPEFAAYCATFFELTCPVFLVVGLATRFATLPMFIMAAVIQWTYLDLIDHYYWMMLLGFLLFYGPGKFSIDYLLSKVIVKND